MKRLENLAYLPSIQVPKTSFPPISDTKTKILVLGSLPGDRSLALNQYYGHPRNRFWKLIGVITKNEIPTAYNERIALLLRWQIGVWDIVQSAHRKGSLDGDIKDVRPNDLNWFAATHKNLQTICFNGNKSQVLFDRYFDRNPNISYISLPSTSPANAKISFDDLYTAWKAVLNP